MRRFVFAGALILLAITVSGSAQAGDYAERRIIGFSEDGKHFAFEQFGRQDGSGFAYSEIQIIDITADAWVAGSPVRVLLRNETANIADARAESAKQAQTILTEHGVSHPGQLLASSPIAEIGADPHKVTVNANFPLRGETNPLEFALEEIKLKSADCTAFSQMPINGMHLSMRSKDGDAVTLHKDATIPKSRGCPLSYAISDVVRFSPAGQPPAYAVLLSVFQVGFEGPDRRFIAVTHK